LQTAHSFRWHRLLALDAVGRSAQALNGSKQNDETVGEPARPSTAVGRVADRLMGCRRAANGGLIANGSECSTLADLLADFAPAENHKLYACHDWQLAHEQEIDHLVARWRDLFNVSFDVLLDGLTSIHFEVDRPSRKATNAASDTCAGGHSGGGNARGCRWRTR
jgi:hypothetical protein